MALTKKPRATKKSANTDFKKLKLLVTVVNREKTEFFLDVIAGFEVNLQTTLFGTGTCHSEMRRMLGLEHNNKSVILSVLREDKTEEAMRVLDEKFHSVKGGKGIAFTIPLSSVIGVAMYTFLSNNRTAAQEVK